jgi:hypothetical protein
VANPEPAVFHLHLWIWTLGSTALARIFGEGGSSKKILAVNKLMAGGEHEFK